MNPKLKYLVVGLFSVLCVCSRVAGADPYTDDLSKCLVKSTTDDQKATLVKWIFAMAALHPAVKPIASVSDAQRIELDKGFAKLMEDLLTVTCKTEAQDAVKYDGPDAIRASFAILGQAATRELFTNQDVAKGMSEFGKYIDEKKLDDTLGIQPQSP